MAVTSLPILAGIYMDDKPSVRIALPVNRVPTPPQEGVADGALRPAEGIITLTTGPGADRGGIVWEGTHYRVSGTKLVSVSPTGTVTEIGDVGGSGPVHMDFSFNELGFVSGGEFWYYDGATLLSATDPDVPANLIDSVWIDGYWLLTDGETIVASAVGSASAYNADDYSGTDRPSPIVALKRVLNELHVVSRSFIDVFENIGGTGFPFRRINTAVIAKGAVGTHTSCVFNDTLAVMGGDSRDAVSVYLAANSRAVPIASQEVDAILAGYTTDQLAAALVEPLIGNGGQFIFVHLPDRTLVYDAVASAALEQKVWHVRTTTMDGFEQYRAQNITRVNDTWVVGDPQSTAIGTLTLSSSQHYGVSVRWEATTLMLRNSGKGASMKWLELLSLTGIVVFGASPTLSMSHSPDGVNFSVERSISAGEAGQRDKRIRWFTLGTWSSYRIFRFRGDSKSHMTILSIDAEVVGLVY